MVEKFFDLYFFKSLNNTNDKIKEINITRQTNNIALYSLNQKTGRGRKGRFWLSQKGDLTCSILIKKKISISDIGRVNILIASILINVFKNLGLANVEFKWPNDVLINKKKIAGVLIETNVSKNIVNQFTIGIGVNVKSRFTNSNFLSTSFNDLGIEIESINLFFLILKNLYFYIENFTKIEFSNLSKNLTKCFFDKESSMQILCGKNTHIGEFQKINSYGELMLKNEEGNLKIRYGEII